MLYSLKFPYHYSGASCIKQHRIMYYGIPVPHSGHEPFTEVGISWAGLHFALVVCVCGECKLQRLLRGGCEAYYDIIVNLRMKYSQEILSDRLEQAEESDDAFFLVSGVCDRSGTRTFIGKTKAHFTWDCLATNR